MGPKKKNRHLDDWEKDFEALDDNGDLKEPEVAVKPGAWPCCGDGCGAALSNHCFMRTGMRIEVVWSLERSRQVEEKGPEKGKEGRCVRER